VRSSWSSGDRQEGSGDADRRMEQTRLG
jgi:hypothetical protein